MSDEHGQPGEAFTLAEAARRLGLSQVTILGYQREGLIDERHIISSGDGRCAYDVAAVERLGALVRVTGTVLTPHEMRTLAADLDAGTLTRERQLQFFRDKLAELKEEAERLEVVRREVAATIARLQADES